jgi:hypothetical protein
MQDNAFLPEKFGEPCDCPGSECRTQQYLAKFSDQACFTASDYTLSCAAGAGTATNVFSF